MMQEYVGEDLPTSILVFQPSQPGSVPEARQACPLASFQRAALVVQTLGMLPARNQKFSPTP